MTDDRTRFGSDFAKQLGQALHDGCAALMPEAIEECQRLYDQAMASAATLMPARPWRYEKTKPQGNGVFAATLRPIYEVYAADGTWIARVAGETEEQAEAIAVFMCAAANKV